MTELLPCPFCGGEAALCHPSFGRPYVCCDANFCSGPKDTTAEAIAAWNRRAPVWQPIATAPTGVDIMFHSIVPKNVSLHMGIAAWARIAVGQRRIKTDKRGADAGVVCLFRVGNQLLKRATAEPTHWQPLPAPPQEPTNE